MSLDLQPIIERKQELERVIHELTTRIAQAPPGHLVISKHKQSESVKYYQRVSSKGNGYQGSRKTYIRKTDLTLIKALANKGYYLTVLSRVRAEYAVISRFLKTYPAELGEDIYPKLSEDRKPLVDPYWEPADVFLERWLREEYPRKGFREDDPYYVTERGGTSARWNFGTRDNPGSSPFTRTSPSWTLQPGNASTSSTSA